MLLNEINDTKLHKATIEIFSRGNTRSGSWSTKKVRERIQNAGYKITGAQEDDKDNQIIQVVHLEGTRDDIIKARKDIDLILKTLATRKVPTKFTLIK